MTFRLVISKATRLKMWSCDLKVWFEKWRWGRIFVEVWHQLQTSFSRALARPSALGWKPRKVVIQSTHQVLWVTLWSRRWDLPPPSSWNQGSLLSHLFGSEPPWPFAWSSQKQHVWRCEVATSRCDLRNGGEEEFLWNCGTSCKLHFRVPLQSNQHWGGSHGKLSYNPHIRCCGGPCPDYIPFCGTPKASCRGIYLEPSSGDPALEAAL